MYIDIIPMSGETSSHVLSMAQPPCGACPGETAILSQDLRRLRTVAQVDVVFRDLAMEGEGRELRSYFGRSLLKKNMSIEDSIYIFFFQM